MANCLSCIGRHWRFCYASHVRPVSVDVSEGFAMPSGFLCLTNSLCFEEKYFSLSWFAYDWHILSLWSLCPSSSWVAFFRGEDLQNPRSWWVHRSRGSIIRNLSCDTQFQTRALPGATNVGVVLPSTFPASGILSLSISRYFISVFSGSSSMYFGLSVPTSWDASIASSRCG